MFPHAAGRVPSVLSALLVAAALAGCKSSGGTDSTVCTPGCPAGTHCESSGCVANNPAGPPPADMALTVGGCQPACGGGTPVCSPRGNCVGCAADSDCAKGQLCHVINDAQAWCVPGCTADARCPGGTSCCGGLCLDTVSDPQNCGACGRACSAAHAEVSCQAGGCLTGACALGWGDCNKDPADGCETSTSVDPLNCGTCGKKCSLPNARAGCSAGCYIQACNFGWDDCNSKAEDGCETSVLSDLQNCGGCGMACKGLPNARSKCEGGACGIASCNPGFGDCDGNPANGCEQGLLADARNCGGCGLACDPGLVCKAGGCTCPQCDNVFPHASARCKNQQCMFDMCNPGWADCDGNLKNGCESQVDSDPNNCGACNNVCPQNMPVCLNGKCSNVDLSGVFNSYMSEGRNVHLWKTPVACADLAKYTDFCTKRGLAWFFPKSAQDAQTLITNAYNIDMFHTWIQIYGLDTKLGNGNSATMGGFTVTVDSGNCVGGSPGGNQFGAIRKWACSLCDPPTSNGAGNQSCCWDKGHNYDWFVCED